jgi:DNA-binding YbaB/EbfC family protein
MFGDLLGNMEQQQAAMREELDRVELKEILGDGAVEITASGNGEILNISIDKEKIDLTDTEELEDLLLIAINRVLEKSDAAEAAATQESLKNIMPPGMGGLGSLFGK